MSCYMFVAFLPDDGSSELKACSSQVAHAVLDAFSVSYKFYLSCFCLSHSSFNSSTCLSLLLFNLVIFTVWFTSVFFLVCSFFLTQLCTQALLLLGIETDILLKAVICKSDLSEVYTMFSFLPPHTCAAKLNSCFLSVCSLWQVQQFRKVEW